MSKSHFAIQHHPFGVSLIYHEDYTPGFLPENTNEPPGLICFMHGILPINYWVAVQKTWQQLTGTNQLSKGQKRRLALISDLLMDKEILVLDEWATEQYPIFKEYFYKDITPIFRTIIVVTHDDDYLQCADKVVRFRNGKVENITKEEIDN